MFTPDLLFQIANPVAMLGWTLLVLAPRWRGTRAVVLSGALPLLMDKRSQNQQSECS